MDRPTRELGDQFDSTALMFRSEQDCRDYARHQVEHFNERFAAQTSTDLIATEKVSATLPVRRTSGAARISMISFFAGSHRVGKF